MERKRRRKKRKREKKQQQQGGKGHDYSCEVTAMHLSPMCSTSDQPPHFKTVGTGREEREMRVKTRVESRAKPG